ncbi:MAG: hypothetical protein R3E01_32375 [Pirellulaceae bacterium]
MTRTTSVDLLSAPIVEGNIGGVASADSRGNPFSLMLAGVSIGDTVTVSGVMVDGVDISALGGQSVFLDNFVLRQVQEPSSALLLVVAGMTLALRRR